jgi:YHS domain-containing protein
MSGLLSFLLFAGVFFFLMRFGCGAHAGHGGHGGGGGEGGGPAHGGPAVRTLSASVDPVCGMRIESDMGYAKMYRGNAYRFCSRECLDKFEAEPERYAARTPAPAAPMTPGHQEQRS